MTGEPARRKLAEALVPLFPVKGRWQLVEGEQAAEDSGRTRVRIAQRSIRPADSGYVRAHLVTFRITITVPSGDGLEAAEAQLDDDMDAFLYALDFGTSAEWTSADKGQFGDEGGRLGYSVDITIRTNREE